MVLKIFSKSFLGIDIGTSAIKGVELSGFGKKITLENYFQVPTAVSEHQQFRDLKRSVIFLPSEEIVEAIKTALALTKIKTKNCIFVLPDFLTFFTIFTLPSMTEEEIGPAVKIEARKYIPIPLKEVTLDWQILEKEKVSFEKGPTILLVAVPNEIIYKYQKIAILSNLKILALEAEVFTLLRALGRKEKEKIVAIIDIGVKSTTCTIIERGVLKTYHSLRVSGGELTERLSRELGIEWKLVEKLKGTWGLSLEDVPLETEEKRVYQEIFENVLKPLLQEFERIFRNFYLKEGKEIDKIILAGGISLTPGILQFFKDYFKKEVELANPFEGISFPPKLGEILKKRGPSFSVAVGAALRYLIK